MINGHNNNNHPKDVSPELSKENSKNDVGQKLKMDLSQISYLKPHIMNTNVYNLAHQGHTRA